jgi:signal peptidase II
MHRNWRFFILVVAVAVAADAVTKAWALRALQRGVTEPALGGWLPLTLSFNRGIAFGLSVGPASRAVFTVLTVVVLGVAMALYAATPEARRIQRLALCLMCAGAIGNLVDRVFRPRGVVDFIGPYDLGFMSWPIFNVADCYVVVGTLGFAAALWWARRHDPAPSRTAGGAPGPGSA